MVHQLSLADASGYKIPGEFDISSLRKGENRTSKLTLRVPIQSQADWRVNADQPVPFSIRHPIRHFHSSQATGSGMGREVEMRAAQID